MMGVATVWVFYAGIAQIFGKRVAFWSALILGTCVEFFYLGKAAVTDMTLLFFLTAALLSFLTARYHWMYVCMALATLTKGPIGFVLPGAVIFLYFCVTREWRLLKQMKLFSGSLLFLLIAAPWYVLMCYYHGAVFPETFLGFHNLTRFTTPEHPTRVLWYYYLPVILVGVFPWTGLLFQSLVGTVTSASGDDLKKMVFFHCWWLFVLIFFSLSQTKLVSYIFPLFPPLAIIIGWNIMRLSRESYGASGWGKGLVNFAVYACLAAGFWLGARELPEIQTEMYSAAIIILFLGTALGLAYVYFRDIFFAAKIHAATGLLLTILLFYFMLPQLGGRFSVQKAAEFYIASCEQGVPVYVDKFLRPGFMFYSGEPGTEFIPDSADYQKFLQASGKRYAVVRGIELRRWQGVRPEQIEKIFAEDDIYILRLQ